MRRPRSLCFFGLLSQLRAELVREGLFRPNWPVQVSPFFPHLRPRSPQHTKIVRLLEVLLLQVLSLWVVCNYSYVLGGLLYGIVVGRNGLLMHDMVRALCPSLSLFLRRL